MIYLHVSVKVFLNKGTELGRLEIVAYAFTILEILSWEFRLLAKKSKRKRNQFRCHLSPSNHFPFATKFSEKTYLIIRIINYENNILWNARFFFLCFVKICMWMKKCLCSMLRFFGSQKEICLAKFMSWKTKWPILGTPEKRPTVANLKNL